MGTRSTTLWRRGAAVLTGAAVLLTVTSGASARQTSSRGARSPAGTQTISVQVGRQGCNPSTTTLHAGPATFELHVADGNTVNEVELIKAPIILAERENLLATKTDYSFSLMVPSGPLTLTCPGGATVRTPMTATGTPPPPPNPRQVAAVERYRTWVEGQSRQLVDSTLAFSEALETGDLAQAKARYAKARVFYERVEPIAESFGTLDPQIDARAGDVPVRSWTGFHPIEQILWTHDTTKGTDALRTKLVANVTQVNSIATRIALTPSQIANGAVTLLDEVAQSKITGEEERYSHIDLVDFAANLDGSKAAFEAVRPLLPEGDRALGQTIESRFDDAYLALGHYRTNDGDGFVRYGALTHADTRKLSQVIDALAEPLSQVSAKVLH